MRSSRLLTSLLLLGILTIPLSAGPAAQAGPMALIEDDGALPSWANTVAGPGAAADTATDVIQLKGQVSLICGTLTNAAGSTDISLSRFRQGTLQWTRTWNGPADAGDTARKMALSPDGKYVYICGQSVNKAGSLDLWVLKRKVSSGGLAWARKYDGAAKRAELAIAVGCDGAGNVVAACLSENAADPDIAVVSWKPSGKLRWTWRWDGKQGADMPLDLLVMPAGDCYVTGPGTAAGGRIQAVTARLSPAGKKLWLKKYLGPASLGAGTTSLARCPAGGVYVAGYATGAATGNDALVLRYSPKGARSTVVIRDSGGGTDELFWDVAVTSTKALVAVGHVVAGLDNRPYVTVWTPAGALLFQGVKPTAGSDSCVACATDAFGGWYVLAPVHVAPGDVRAWTYRSSVLYSPGMWQSEYGPSSPDTMPKAISVHGTTCAVAGQVGGMPMTGTDQLLLVYNY